MTRRVTTLGSKRERRGRLRIAWPLIHPEGRPDCTVGGPHHPVSTNDRAVDLLNARRRANHYLPFSPAWDAAMGMVDELERRAWLLDRAAIQLARGHVTRRGDADRIPVTRRVPFTLLRPSSPSLQTRSSAPGHLGSG